jgi:pilus assembly protein Flp/PilA
LVGNHSAVRPGCSPPPILDKGKPVARPGRKAKDLAALARQDRLVAERTLVARWELSPAWDPRLAGYSSRGWGTRFVLSASLWVWGRPAPRSLRVAGPPSEDEVTLFCAGVVSVRTLRRPRPTRLEDAMNFLSKKVRHFLVSEDGPTAVEYAVMLALIVIVCLTAIQAIGTNANSTFNNIANVLSTTSGTSS